MSLKQRFSALFKGQLIKSAGVYGVASLLNSVLPFLLLPVLSYYLSPEEYGLVAMFLLVQNIFGPLVSLNSSSAASKRYFYDEPDEIFGKYVFNGLLVIGGCGIILAGLTAVFNAQLSSLTKLDSNWLFLALLSAACFGVVQMRLAIWQVKSKTRKYAIFQVSMVALKLLLSLLFVVTLLYGWQGRVWAVIAGHVLFAIIALVSMVMSNELVLKYDKPLLSHMIRFGAPIVPHSLAGFAIAYTDRLIVSNLIGLQTMGLYTVAYQVGSVFNMGTKAFNMAFIPWLYEKLKKSEKDAKVKLQVIRVTYVSMIAMVLCCLLLIIGLPLVFKILSPEYRESTVFLSYLLLGFMFNGMYYLVCNYLFYSEKTIRISAITISSALLNIPLTYIFVSKYGALGAAQATLAVNALTFGLTWWMSQRTVKMPWFQFRSLLKTK